MRLIVLLSLIASLELKAELLGAGPNPSSIFQHAPQSVAEFINVINQNPELNEQQKAAYQSLVEGPGELAGDEVLELIDEETIKWFYQGTEDSVGTARSMKMSRISNEQDLEDCMRYPLCVHISKKTQRLNAYLNGNPVEGLHQVRISTARAGKWTPVGTFAIEELAGANRSSGRYKGAPLSYAMQVVGHIFIHGTSKANYPKLGSPASAGCIRTTFDVAKNLNFLMREIGGRNQQGKMDNPDQVRVVITSNN